MTEKQADIIRRLHAALMFAQDELTEFGPTEEELAALDAPERHAVEGAVKAVRRADDAICDAICELPLAICD